MGRGPAGQPFFQIVELRVPSRRTPFLVRRGHGLFVAGKQQIPRRAFARNDKGLLLLDSRPQIQIKKNHRSKLLKYLESMTCANLDLGGAG